MSISILSYEDVATPNIMSFRAAASRRGVELEEWYPHDVSVWCDGGDAIPLYRGEAVVPRILLHRTISRLIGVLVPALELWRQRGAVVLNSPMKAAISRDKLATFLELAKAGVPYVPSLGFYPSESVPLHLCGDGPIVVKPARGLQGLDVACFPNIGSASQDLRERRWRMPPTFVAEHSLAEPLIGSGGEDLRAFVVEGACVGVIGRRSALPSEVRANLALGGQGRAVVREDAEELALSAAAALGLDYCGVDMIENNVGGLMVLEVDAWAGFAGLERVLDVDVAGSIVDLALCRAGLR